MHHHKHIKGVVVFVKDDNLEKALRKFKKKVADSGLLQNLRERETYEKPAVTRKKAQAAAKNRWRKEIAKQQLPKRLY